jgi:hypothetical protein
VCVPLGTIAVDPSTAVVSASVGQSIQLLAVSYVNTTAAVNWTTSGLPPSRFNLSGPGLGPSTLTFPPRGNVSLTLTLLAVANFTPQATLLITLSGGVASGVAVRVSQPGQFRITVQASDSPTGVVQLALIAPSLAITPGISTVLPLQRAPPSTGAAGMASISVPWSANCTPPLSGTAVFAAGAVAANATILLPNDGVPRLAYTALLSLGSGSGVVLGLSSNIVLIVPDANYPHGLLELNDTVYEDVNVVSQSSYHMYRSLFSIFVRLFVHLKFFFLLIKGRHLLFAVVRGARGRLYAGGLQSGHGCPLPVQLSLRRACMG